MANVADLLVRIEANTQQMRNELRKGEGVVNRFDKNVSRAALSSSTALDRLGRSARATVGILAGLGVGLGVAEIATGIAQVNAQFQDLQTSLKVATGSAEAADTAFAGLRVFAKETPFQLSEVTQAFISLKNLGLDPSIDSLRAYGDIASSFNGKSLDDFIQAVADATTGEFERLKEFGIKASSEGDKVAFTFRKMTTTIGKNATEIEGYLQDLARNNFGGAMSEKMDNLSGRFSNLKDQVDDLYVTIGESGGIDVMAAALDLASSAVNGLADNLDHVATVIALVGAAAAGKFLGPMIASMGASAIATATATVNLLRYQAVLPPMAASARAAAAGVAALGVAARGTSAAMAFLGGPVGAAITVLAGGVYLLSQAQGDAERAADLHRDAMEQLNGVTQKGNDLAKTAAEVTRDTAKARIEEAKAANEQVLATTRLQMAQLKEQRGLLQRGSPGSPLIDGVDKELTSLSFELVTATERVEDLDAALVRLGERGSDSGLPDGGSGGGGGDSKEADKIQKVIDSLEYQRAQLTRTSRDQEIYNALQQAGISSSHAMAAAITQAAGAYYDAAEAVDTLKQKTEAEDNARAAIAQSIADLERENRLLQVQGIERDKLRTMLDLEAKAREGGIELSEKEREKIDALTDANARLAKAEEDAAEAARDARQYARDFGSVISNSFEDAILSGEKFGDILKSLEQDIARIILRMAVTKPLENAIGGFDWGGLFGNIAGSFFGGGAASGPGVSYPAGSTFANGGIMTAQGEVPLRKYASGGIATSPQLAMFGEGSTPEAYVPLPDGRNIPVKLEGGGESFTYAPTIMVDAQGSKLSRDEIRSIVKTAVDGSVAQVREIQKRKGNARI
ncbi:tape measure protein [Thalassospira lohafexi]|uniref:Tape measure protein N-terminal domain-containing protein n=1 Tax=Thalassospira lohafexi TaxID=744227 RepID=A0A2N3L453_9PROT|nr:tape measure protein [Thalassospira lohafexi]PKR57506.1 hypothetical protein COO92_16325 [Thalassospira lohafexi]